MGGLKGDAAVVFPGHRPEVFFVEFTGCGVVSVAVGDTVGFWGAREAREKMVVSLFFAREAVGSLYRT
jgi:hypothetical protein